MLKNRTYLFIGGAFLLLLLYSHSSLSSDLKRQQELFTKVEHALKKGNYELYQKHQSDLENYPLVPYLEYLILSANLKDLAQVDIERFSDKYPNLPQAKRLERQWLKYLANNKKWQLYLQAYNQDDQGYFQCLKGMALYHLGHKEKAWKEAEQLWLKGSSQHKACNPLFTQWKKSGKLTQDLIQTRFWMAVEQNNVSFARYLDSLIKNKSSKVLTSQFWKIHQKPQLLRKSNFDGEKEAQRIIMIHGIKKLLSKDLNLTVNLWLKMRDKYPFSLKKRSEIDQKIAMKAAKNFVENAQEIIARIDPDFHYNRVTEWRIRIALSEQDWEKVVVLIDRLPIELQNQSRWRYWKAVASVKYQEEQYLTLGIPLPKDTTILKARTFMELGKERNFYAFMVADLRGKPFQLNQQKIDISEQDLQRLKKYYPGLQRIREWVHLKRFYNAQLELNRITPYLNETQGKLIPYLASQWEWHHQAIMAAARATLWNDLDIRFPTPDAQLFSEHAQERDLDYPWVLAIARQESAFHPRARSPSGALGLMQLMPATAKQAAKKAGIPFRKKTQLYKPNINIALGTTHLSWLVKRFEDSKILATAAYNAGSTPVKRWIKQRGHLPLDIWIETIPYDETRKYVQNVMAFRIIYSMLEKQPVRMFSQQEIAALSLNQPKSTVVAQRERHER